MTTPTLPIPIVLLTDCIADLEGGAERQIFELAKRLDKNKYQVFVVSLESFGKAPRETIEAAGCRFFDFCVVRIYGWSGFCQGLKFFSFLRKNKIRILFNFAR